MIQINLMSINILLCAIVCLNSAASSTTPNPIILVPGAAGSRAYSYIGCENFDSPSVIWIHLGYMLFPSTLTENFKLIYDPVTHTTRNVNCSKVFFPGWGSTETIEYLTVNKLIKTVYYGTLVKNLIEDKFYERNKTVRGAPYDFRKAPNENEDFVPKMKKLVEDTYKLSDNRRVVLLGHSMGSLYCLFFLKQMSMSWKKKHVRAFISVSAPLGGAVKAIIMELLGSNLGSVRGSKHFRELQRSFPSTAFNLPRPEIYGNESIVITPERNYSAYDLKALFKDFNLTYESMMYDDTKDLVRGEEAPEGIDELYCIYSHGLPTINQLKYKSLQDTKPSEIIGDGDATVNINSLETCHKWKNVKYFTIKDINHRKILGHPDFINKLKQILYRQPNKSFKPKTFGFEFLFG